MITRVEISGFKTFTNFSVDLAPLSVIAGANASGKSNFLDALEIIKGLATGRTLGEANGRLGSASLLFTNYGAGRKADKINFAVELLIPLIKDPESRAVLDLSNRLRYEIEVANDLYNSQHFLITNERLSVIGSNGDEWIKRHLNPETIDQFLRQPASPGGDIMGRVFHLRPDMIPANHRGSAHGNQEISWLSSQTNGSYPQASAVREYFLNQHYVDLIKPDNFSNFDNPERNDSLVLRELQEMAMDRPEDIRAISRTVGTIAREIHKLEVKVDDFDRVSVIGINKDGAKFIFPHLSEGTLRTIALATLLYRDTDQQTIMLEEPENGIDPRVLKKIIRILSRMVMNPDDPAAPLVQVICTTHSPIVLDLIVGQHAPQRIKGYLAWTYNKTVFEEEDTPQTVVATLIAPVNPNIDAPIPESRQERDTWFQAERYMSPERLTNLQDA